MFAQVFKRGTSAGAHLAWANRGSNGLPDAAKQLRNGKITEVPKEKVGALLRSFAGGDDHPDLTNLTVDGQHVFGKDGLNIPRNDMPQIPRSMREKFLEDHHATKENVDPLDLKPVQHEIDGNKVGMMLKKMDAGDYEDFPIIVSKNGYIIDGHHTWATHMAERLTKPKTKISIYRLDMGHKELLEEANKFTDKHDIKRKDITKMDFATVFKAGTSAGAKKAWAKRQSNALPDSKSLEEWYGADSNLRTKDGAPMPLFHGTTKRFTEFNKSTYGAMGPAVYLGDDEEVSQTYSGDGKDALIYEVHAKGKYLTNLQWTDYVNKHGWDKAETAARKEGWAGVHDTMFENAVAVWDPTNIKIVKVRQPTKKRDWSSIFKGTSAGATLAWSKRNENALPDVKSIQFAGKGKGWKMADGSDLTPEVAAAIKRSGQAIPPAWTEVRVNTNPTASCIVQGRDAKGRPQSRYSTEHTANSGAQKFARITELTAKMPTIMKQSAKDMMDESLTARKRDDAATINLIAKTGFRPGSDDDTGADEKAFGASTLEKRHIKLLKDNVIHFSFTGKSGVSQDKYLRDKPLHEYLSQKLATLTAEEQVFSSSGASAGKYLKGLAGDQFKVKDLRTWNGTALARNLVKDYEAPKNQKEFKALQNEVADAVSEHLGNTRAVAIATYIDPAVWPAITEEFAAIKKAA
jgi:DNA topoisomerase-1